MDIKPQNVLLRRITTGSEAVSYGIYLYLTHFGISKHFASNQHSQTDGLIARSRKYCAPQVYNSEPRGRSAHVFSLGCVFVEMETVMRAKSLEEFADFRAGDSCEDADCDDSFHANPDAVRRWIALLQKIIPGGTDHRFGRWTERLRTIEAMLDASPEKRPLASEVLARLGAPRPCRTGDRETYEAAQPDGE
ncbi:MAG: hypothetical protein M1833_003209 [Piccolia ochrophora]|nr:MAG: hypothetical protein M1833_003209 [Piccolia ochrophora]